MKCSGVRVCIAAVAELHVGRKGGKELAGRDTQTIGTAEVAQIDLAERVALFMADTARRVIAEEHLVGVIDRVDPVHQDEVAFALGKHDQLRPTRTGFAAGGGVLVLIGRFHRDEIRAANHLRLDGLHSVAKLRAFNRPFAMFASVGHDRVLSSVRIGFVRVPAITAEAVPVVRRTSKSP